MHLAGLSRTKKGHSAAQFASISGVSMDILENTSNSTAAVVNRSRLRQKGGISYSGVFSPTSLKNALPKPVSNVRFSKIVTKASTLDSVKYVSPSLSRNPSQTGMVEDKRTLEVQFAKKNKRFLEMKVELNERQQPVIDLYKRLVEIKKKLEKFGRKVNLDGMKIFSLENDNIPMKAKAVEKIGNINQTVENMKSEIVQMNTKLVEASKNLLTRRTVVVNMLGSVADSTIDASTISSYLQDMKNENNNLTESFNKLVEMNDKKLFDILDHLQLILESGAASGDEKSEQEKLMGQNNLLERYEDAIANLKQQLQQNVVDHEKTFVELNAIIANLRKQVSRLEDEVQHEKRSASDIRQKTTHTTQNVKYMRAKIAKLESEKKQLEESTADMKKTIERLQAMTQKNQKQWETERAGLDNVVQDQLSKIETLDKTHAKIKTAMEMMEEQKMSVEDRLQYTVEQLSRDLESSQGELTSIRSERDELKSKCEEMESFINRTNKGFKHDIEELSLNLDWGRKKVNPESGKEADKCIDSIAKDIKITELQDQIDKYERKLRELQDERRDMPEGTTETQRARYYQTEMLKKYEMLLEQSEQNLEKKTKEVVNLRGEIQGLKLRLDMLEQENKECPTQELQKMLADGRARLGSLMQSSYTAEEKISAYIEENAKLELQIKKLQTKILYQENKIDVLQISRKELLEDNKSLKKFSQELKETLTQCNSERKKKESLVKTLKEKVELREIQVKGLEKKMKETGSNLEAQNKKIFLMQNAMGSYAKNQEYDI